MSEQAFHYILGTFAIWAEDYAAAREFLKPQSAKKIPARGERKLTDYLVLAEQRRIRQLEEAGETFHRAIEASGNLVGDIRAGAITLQVTQHLKATFKRIGRRRFIMRAYPRELSWIPQLIETAGLVSHRTNKSSDDAVLATPVRGVPRPKSTGFSWVQRGTLFTEIHVSRIGLISATAIWTSEEQVSRETLEAELGTILVQLDPPTHQPRVPK